MAHWQTVIFWVLFLLFIIHLQSRSQMVYDPPEGQGYPIANELGRNQTMRAYLRRLTVPAFEKRKKKINALSDTVSVREYQDSLKRFFLSKLNLPERFPLNAQIIDTLHGRGYEIEKIIYQTQPGFYVPALFYKPKMPPSWPAVLIISGHEPDAKADSMYQKMAILLARNGMAVLTPEPLGSGERKLYPDKNGRERYRATTEHLISAAAPILLGINLATYMVWDAVRAVDYLQQRPEIKADKIGVLGHSGGGNRTSYLMAFDDRVSCAAVSGFMTSMQRKNESPGPGDAEQNIHNQIAYGLDYADYIIMRAPKPTLILSASNDYLSIEGAREAFREAEKIYALFGRSGNVKMKEAPGGHGLSPSLRLAAAQWLSRWLLGRDLIVQKIDYDLRSREELNCTPQGQVLFMKNARALTDLNMEAEKRLAAERKGLWKKQDRQKLTKDIRKLCNIRKADELPPVTASKRGELQRNGYRIEKWTLEWEEGVPLSALCFVPPKKSDGKYLFLHPAGKWQEGGKEGAIEKLVLRGNTVLAVDLRGIGATRTTPWRYTAAIDFVGGDVAEFFLGYMLNKSFLGMWTEDVLACARWLSEKDEPAGRQPVYLLAEGKLGPAALHAIFLEPDLFAGLTLKRSLYSWQNVVNTTQPKNQLINTVHGALTVYDLTDLVRCIGNQKVEIVDPLDAGGAEIKNR